jgi:hypothetical protein
MVLIWIVWFLICALAWRVEYLTRQPPAMVIGGCEDPYLLRWYVIPRNRWMNIYLHNILRSDIDRCLHDHPWWNCSVLLSGQYTEVRLTSGALSWYKRLERQRQADMDDRFEKGYPVSEGAVNSYGLLQESRVRKAPCLVLRQALTPHRLEITKGSCWTLFFTGPVLRDWGFHTRHGWMHWRSYVDPQDPGQPRPEYRS